MLEDFRLQVFLAVAEEGSFTRAAAKLNISQPAVSQNIAELERLLDRKLFDRLKGETVLTPEGHVFRRYVDEMMMTCSSIGNMFSKIPPTTVRISASEELYAFLIGPALENFSNLHPDVIFERCMFDDADLSLRIRPSSYTASADDEETILRVRMSVAPANEMGDLAATHERTSCFDVVFQPSPAFSCTRLCRLIKAFLLR